MDTKTPTNNAPFYWEKLDECSICGTNGANKAGVEFHGKAASIIICQECLWLATIAVWDAQVEKTGNVVSETK